MISIIHIYCAYRYINYLTLPLLYETGIIITWVQSLVQEDTLEKKMAMHSSILAWKIAWTEEPGGLQFMAKELGTTEPVYMHTYTHTHSVM